MDFITIYTIVFSIVLLCATGIHAVAFVRLGKYNNLARRRVTALRERRFVALVLLASSSAYALTGLNALFHILPQPVGISLLSTGILIEVLPSINWLRLDRATRKGKGFMDDTS